MANILGDKKIDRPVDLDVFCHTLMNALMLKLDIAFFRAGFPGLFLELRGTGRLGMSNWMDFETAPILGRGLAHSIAQAEFQIPKL